MKVIIGKDTEPDYQPDFRSTNKEWRVKLKDAFRVDVICNTKCFIKRFESDPSAIGLLRSLINKPVVNMPLVFDLVTNIENGKIVHYLFTEHIAGLTLKEHIIAEKPFDIKKIAADIAGSLEFLHNHGYWFTDFNDENIFCADNGRYLLIDVDSCTINSISPNEDAAKPGGMPGAAQESANIVLLFYRDIVKLSGFVYQDIQGKNLNCLQLAAFLTKLTVYLENKKNTPRTPYINKKIYKDLQDVLLNKNELYSKNIFNRALKSNFLDTPASYHIFREFYKFITGENMTPENDLPVIDHFKISNSTVTRGTETTLLWSVKNAVGVSISSESASFLQNGPLVSTLKTKPATTETYTLTAIGKQDRRVTRSLLVSVTEPLRPKINYFRADKAKVKKGEMVMLSWQTENVEKLYIDGAEINADLSSNFVNPQKNTTYSILAENAVGERVSNQVYVKVATANYWWIIVIAVILLILGIWQYVVYAGYASNIRNGHNAESNGNYETAVEDFKNAQRVESQIFWGIDPGLDDEINKAHMLNIKKRGETLLTQGIILSPPDKPDNDSAYGYFTLAKTYHIIDTDLNNRLIFCKKVYDARSYSLRNESENAVASYIDAKAYGDKINVPVGALNVIKDNLNFLTKPTSQFDSLWVERPSFDGSKYGIKIHFRVEIYNLKDVRCQVVAKFFNSTTDEPVSNTSVLYSQNGHLVVNRDVIPCCVRSIASDVDFFIPYDELSTVTDFKFNGSIISDGVQIGEVSKFYDISYSKK